MTRDPLSARIEISQSALEHNANNIRQRLGSERQLAAVLKGNAYGHGRDLVARLLLEHVDLLAAAEPTDALALAPVAPGRVLCLGPAHGAVLRTCVREGVRVAVSNPAQIDDLPAGAKVHLQVDTGLHRLGLSPDDAPIVADAVRARGAEIEAAFCMVSRADYGEWDAVEREIAVLDSLPLGPVRRHTGGSSVTLERPDLAGDLGRVGLAVLGHHPRVVQRELVDLRPSLRLVAPVLELREVQPGESVGYQAVQLRRRTTVATLPLGVAHGLHPLTDSRVVAMVRGKACPFLCPPSLDYSLLDVTDVPGTCVGADVTVLGGEPGTPTSVADVADRLGVIIDHILTPLSPAIRRVAVD